MRSCYECGASDQEIEEVIAVALIVGGSIIIPCIRRAVSFWDNLNSNK
ncbi:MAG: hypothetical protein KAU06_04285 [Candidatus Marinimicrobia bacterium]|nr:hypothetical protein [Candidatus Neomarinimicrobiota bacterium]